MYAVRTITDIAGTYSYLDAGAEQVIYTSSLESRREVTVLVSNRNMTQTGTLRLYERVNGANYDLASADPVAVAAGSDRAFRYVFITNRYWQLTYQEDVDEGAARDVPYMVIERALE